MATEATAEISMEDGDTDHEGEVLGRRGSDEQGVKRPRQASSDEEGAVDLRANSPQTLPKPRPKQRRGDDTRDIRQDPERVDTRQLGESAEDTRTDVRQRESSKRRRRQWAAHLPFLRVGGIAKQPKQRGGKGHRERRESARRPLLEERRRLQVEAATGELEQVAMQSEMEKMKAKIRLLQVQLDEEREENRTLKAEKKAMKKELGVGLRKDKGTRGAQRWSCVVCQREQLTGGASRTEPWEYKWCRWCVNAACEGKIASEQQVREGLELQQRNEQLSFAAADWERRLARLEEACDAKEQLLEQAHRDEVILEHERHAAQVRKQASKAYDEMWECQKEVRNAQKMLQRLQREGWECEFNERLADSMASEAARILVDNGAQVQATMDAAIEGVQGLEKKQVEGLAVYTYKDATTKAFRVRGDCTDEQAMEIAVRQATLRRECRGLVVDIEGVAARPLHKFFTVGQVADTQMDGQFENRRVAEATMKVDGVMVYGVRAGGEMQLWTRGGPSCIGQNAMRYARGVLLADYMGLLCMVESMGSTAIFEWVGRQARIKAKENDTGLILLQIRDKLTGAYMGAEQRTELAARYKVECAHRFRDMEGVTVKEAQEMVRKIHTQEEGFVLKLENGQFVKLKTNWWLQKEPHRYLRWWDETQQQAESLRNAKQLSLMQKQEQRAVLKGWPGSASPGTVFEVVPAVVKVEVFIARTTGKRGALVLSFQSAEEKKAANAALMSSGLGLRLVDAYSRKSSSSAWHRIRTWHRLGWQDQMMVELEEKIARAVAEKFGIFTSEN